MECRVHIPPARRSRSRPHGAHPTPEAAGSRPGGTVGAMYDLYYNLAGISGTATNNITESDVVAGSKEIVITLVGTTWHADIGSDSAQTTALIAGIDSAQSEGTGWDAEVKGNMVFGDITRTSDTVVTIVLAAEAAYDITATETITVTIAAACTAWGVEIVASPTFTVAYEAAGAESVSGSYNANGPGGSYDANGITVSSP